MIRTITIIALALFIVVPLTLPFALSSCSGVFCAATTQHMDETNACNAHENAHITLVQQFGQCVLQQSMTIGMILFTVLLSTLLWILIRIFARSFISSHGTFLDALNAPAALSHMKPFDALRFAFAYGNIQSRKNVQTVFA